MNKKTAITCGVIAIGLLCLGAVVVLGGFGALVAFSGDEETSGSDLTELPTSPPAPVEQNQSEVVMPPANLYESVVQIIAIVEMDGELVEGWTGSGSIISPDGFILTNAHVVLSDKFYDVQSLVVAFTVDPSYPAEPRYYAEVMQADEGLDLAVIRVTSDLNQNPVDYATLNLPAVPLGDSDILQLGGKITIMGYPGIGGQTITLTSGDVGGFTSETGFGQRAFIKTSATIAGGNSGGLAVNSNEELIGVPTQLGYGGDDQFVDCRVLADTNRDGAVDDYDSCIPTGGFINALRPIKLALPLIEAARRGEVSFVAESAPVVEAPAQTTGAILFQDDFSSPNSGWDRADWDSGFSDYDNGQYRMLVKVPSYDIWANPGQYFEGDVSVEADAIKTNGDDDNDFGLICRYSGSSDSPNYYYFLISSDGYSVIGKVTSGRSEYISSEQMKPSDAIQQGFVSNRLRADCIGDTFTLYVNGKLVASATDSSFTGGDVGFIVGTFDVPSTEIAFDNLTVYAP